jgi:hypothetical protein
MGWGAASSIAKILSLEEVLFPRSRPDSKARKASWCIDKIQTDVLEKEAFCSAVNAESLAGSTIVRLIRRLNTGVEPSLRVEAGSCATTRVPSFGQLCPDLQE